MRLQPEAGLAAAEGALGTGTWGAPLLAAAGAGFSRASAKKGLHEYSGPAPGGTAGGSLAWAPSVLLEGEDEEEAEEEEEEETVAALEAQGAEEEAAAAAPAPVSGLTIP